MKKAKEIVSVSLGSPKQIFRGKDAKQKEARRLNTDISQMTTGEVVMRLYDRHDTGFWMTIAILSIVSTILVAIF